MAPSREAADVSAPRFFGASHSPSAFTNERNNGGARTSLILEGTQL